MAMLTLTKVVREHIELRDGPDGKTYGQLVDESIVTMLNEGQECQAIELEMDPDEWQKMLAAHFQGQPGSPVRRLKPKTRPGDTVQGSK